MKPAFLVLVSTLVATTAAVLVVHGGFGPRSGEAAIDTPGTGPDLERRLAAVEETLRRLTDRVEAEATRRARRTAPASGDDATPATPRGGQSPAAVRGEAAPAAPAPLDLDATVAKLRSGKLAWEDKAALWQALSKPDQDRLVAAFEKVAKDRPYDADVQNDLGEAYVQRLLGGSFLEMMSFGQKAEKAFDRALEIDDHHWGARFNKAMSLANQPAFLGRRPEAIRHFEKLMQQQEAMPPEPRQAGTYLFLGNLYAQQGKADRAKEVWRRGLGRFPASKELAAKLGR